MKTSNSLSKNESLKEKIMASINKEAIESRDLIEFFNVKKINEPMITYFVANEGTISGTIQKLANVSSSLSEAMLNCYVYGIIHQAGNNDNNILIQMYIAIQSKEYTANKNERDNYWNIKVNSKDTLRDSFNVTKTELDTIITDLREILEDSNRPAEFIYNYLEKTDFTSYEKLFYTLFLMGIIAGKMYGNKLFSF